jgi:hypothetical protein
LAVQSWPLPVSNPREIVRRFDALANLKIRYALYNAPVWSPRVLPKPGTTGNCSIALCWALGLSIFTSDAAHRAVGVEWLNSDGLISLTRRAIHPFSRVMKPSVGDFGAFGWSGGSAGHVWLITDTDPRDGRITQVIDCSPSNGRNDSVRRHEPTARMLKGDVIYGRFRPRGS